jgi:hypothetical protein
MRDLRHPAGEEVVDERLSPAKELALRERPDKLRIDQWTIIAVGSPEPPVGEPGRAVWLFTGSAG